MRIMTTFKKPTLERGSPLPVGLAHGKSRGVLGAAEAEPELRRLFLAGVRLPCGQPLADVAFEPAL